MVVRLNRPFTFYLWYFFFFARYKNIFGKDWLEENRDFRGMDLEWNRVQFLGKRFIEKTLVNDNDIYYDYRRFVSTDPLVSLYRTTFLIPEIQSNYKLKISEDVKIYFKRNAH